MAIPDSQQYSTLSNAIDIAAYVVNVYYTLPDYAADFYELKTRAAANASSATSFAVSSSIAHGHDLKESSVDLPTNGDGMFHSPCAQLFDLGASSSAVSSPSPATAAALTRGFVASRAPTATEWRLLARHSDRTERRSGTRGDWPRASGNLRASANGRHGHTVSTDRRRAGADYCALYRARYLDPTSPVYALHPGAAKANSTAAVFRPSVVSSTAADAAASAADAAPVIVPVRLTIENGLSGTCKMRQ